MDFDHFEPIITVGDALLANQPRIPAHMHRNGSAKDSPRSALPTMSLKNRKNNPSSILKNYASLSISSSTHSETGIINVGSGSLFHTNTHANTHTPIHERDRPVA